MASGVGSIGQSDSATTNLTNDLSVTASEQAVVITPRRSGNNNNNPITRIVVRPGGTYTVNQLLPTPTPPPVPGTPAPQPAPQTGTGGVGNVDAAVDSAVANRVRDQITAGGETAVDDIKGNLSPTNWILLGVGAFLLVAAIFFKARHK